MSSPMLLLLIKVSVLLGVALLAGQLLRHSAAARRHSLWSGAFVALALLPALALVLPPIEISVPSPALQVPATSQRLIAERTSPSLIADRGPVAAVPSPAGPVAPGEVERRLPSLRDGLFMIWLLGFGAAVITLAYSLVRVALLARRGRPVTTLEWHESARDIAARFGIARPIRLITADGVLTPMAAGVVTPTIFLPANAPSWSAERRDIVLAHEIAHLASRDPLRHLVGRAALAFYWFHPLAWLAARDAIAACEQACDEAVLSLGFRASTYAQVLLDFADCAEPAPALALPIVRRGLLETRLMAILDSSPRRAAGRRVIIPAALGVALTLCVAAARPATTSPSTSKPSTTTGSTATPPATLDAPIRTPASVAAKPVASPVIAALSSAAPRTPQTYPALECRRSDWNSGFSGTSSRHRDGRVDYVIQKSFSDVRVCAMAEELDGGRTRPSEWTGRAGLLVLETEARNGDLQRIEVQRGVTVYSVNGRPQAFDADAQEWRRALIGLLDAMWEVSELRGRVSSLRGEISSVRGERSSLMGEISSLRGEVSSMQGQISSYRGEESSMRGEISSIRGHLSSLQGAVSSEQGAISSLRASRNDRYADQVAIDNAIRRHEDEIRRLRGEIDRYDVEGRVREVERRIRDFDVESKVREMERRIRDFDLAGKVAAVERRLAQLDVEGQVRNIESDIAALDADQRVAALEARQDAALQTLRARLRR